MIKGKAEERCLEQWLQQAGPVLNFIENAIKKRSLHLTIAQGEGFWTAVRLALEKLGQLLTKPGLKGQERLAIAKQLDSPSVAQTLATPEELGIHKCLDADDKMVWENDLKRLNQVLCVPRMYTICTFSIRLVVAEFFCKLGSAYLEGFCQAR